MGENTNLGKEAALTVFGNPESFSSVIKNHGQLAKIKQALACPCLAENSNSPDPYCEICGGDGYVYTYQRRFFVADENSKACNNKIYPFWNPILAVTKVQSVTSEIQGGITEATIDSFDETTITLTENISSQTKKRVSYSFDGWTYVASEKLEVDVTNKIMYANGTIYNAKYQSSNPLNAYADISKIVKIWNIDTGAEITDYTCYGNAIYTSQSVVADKMYIEYYYADLTQVVSTELSTRNDNEVWTHALSSGETKLAFYPYWDVTRGDLIIMVATVFYKNEVFTHVKDIDRLHEMEIYELNDIIIDSDGNTYYIDTDYILQGRYVKWIGNKPKVNKSCSVRLGYKPSFIVFDDNPQPLTLENKLYPKICLVKSWSKMDKNDVSKLIL